MKTKLFSIAVLIAVGMLPFLAPTVEAKAKPRFWDCEQQGVIEGNCTQLQSGFMQGWGGYQSISLLDDYGWTHTATLNWECSGWVKLYMAFDNGGVQAQLLWTDGEGSWDIVAYAQAWSELGFPDPAHSHSAGGCPITTSLGLSYQ